VGHAFSFGTDYSKLLFDLVEKSGPEAPAFTVFIAGANSTPIRATLTPIRAILTLIRANSTPIRATSTPIRAGKRMNFLKNPEDFSSVLRDSTRLDFTPVASTVMQDAFGLEMNPFRHPGYQAWCATSPEQYATLRGSKLAPLLSQLYGEISTSLGKQLWGCPCRSGSTFPASINYYHIWTVFLK
jgi:hypothetical protein